MKITFNGVYKLLFFSLLQFIFCAAWVNNSSAQCSVSSAPSYSRSCLTDYFSTISASGTGVTSTIAVSGGSCSGTYFDRHTTQGVTVPMGDSVRLHVLRYTNTYTAYLSVYVDWNNNDTLETTELSGKLLELSPHTLDTTYTFNVPICSVTPGTTLRMRVMLSEITGNAGAPCTANYGQAYDFYLTPQCPTGATITISPSTMSICPTGPGAPLTVSGAWAGVGYAWSPASGLSAVTGTSVTADPSSTTVYTASATACTGCTSSYGTATITVNSTPEPISGPSVVCKGTDITFTDAASGGTWSIYSGITVATVNATTGQVTGLTAGTAILMYVTGYSCYVTKTITVGAPPTPTGFSHICVGESNQYLYINGVDGTWTSSSPTVAGVVSAFISGGGGGWYGRVSGLSAGTANIFYTDALGCSSFASIVVDPIPAAISGSSTVCIGSTVTVTDATSGGVWISTTPTLASVTSSGIVTGLSSGTATVEYALSTGCGVFKNINVASAASITGTLAACAGGGTSTLHDATGGGTWSSGNTSVATISGSGVVTAGSEGTATISYTTSVCTPTAIFTVYPIPSPISGDTLLCTGSTLSLTDGTSGGVWSSSNTAVATVAPGISSGTGVVTGVAAGTVTISYSFGGICTTTMVVRVNNASSILGTTSVCVGSTVSLSNTGIGGVWSSNNTSVATITSDGNVTGVAAGTATITYNDGCVNTVTVTVIASIPSISGTARVCVGSTTPLSDVTTGGNWSSENTSLATVSTSGLVTGVAPGTTTISYSAVCLTTVAVTVSAVPGTINGTRSVCEGLNVTLTNSVSGGVWSSTDVSKATINSSTGVISGVAAGTTTISYTIGGICTATAVLTVNPSPGTINGTALVCFGSTTTLTNSVSGGTWASSNTGVATINSSGVVTSVDGGTTTISYTLSAGCMATRVVTVSPSAIQGADFVCTSQSPASITLSDASAGGSWASSNTLIAGITSGGVVSPAGSGTTGTVTISYTIGSCRATKVVSVNGGASTILGPTTICLGTSVTLSEGATSGTWVSSNTTAATVVLGPATTTTITGTSVGSTTVTFTKPNGCFVSNTYIEVTVGPILGATSTCYGTAVVLSDATSGVTTSWTSSNTSVATVTSPGGNVTPVSSGTTTISYVSYQGCIAYTVFTVNPLPSAISGASTVCAGFTITLSDATTGGAWSSSNTAKATVDASTGVVAGVAAGTATITYTSDLGCRVTKTITVTASPAAISGASVVCHGGSTVSLSDATSGGTWSSSSTSIATVSSGTVTGVAAGTVTISYVVSGCPALKTITVNDLPAAISGATPLCVGSSYTFTESVSGGTWSSSNTSVASVSAGSGSDGNVFASAAGTATISYSTGAPCTVTKAITVNSAPAAITGTTSVCTTLTTDLDDATSSGTWSCSPTAIATINSSTGLVTGVSAGTASVIYTANLCSVTATVTVYEMPADILYGSSVCEGAHFSLGETTTGGVWASSNSGIATVNSFGLVTGVTHGTATISYTTGGICTKTTSIPVTASPSAITGTNHVCMGSTVTLADLTSGGAWSSDVPGVATISTSGVVTPVSAGTTTISYYAMPCSATLTFTVYDMPNINGASTACTGSTVSLTDTHTGGTWTSSNTSLATVNSSGGTTIGSTAGTVTISHTLAGGCTDTHNITVYVMPAGITGGSSVCEESTLTLGETVSGGAWSSSNSHATVSGGVVTGVSAGTATISYSIGTCFVTTTITVNSAPVAISGSSSLCLGVTTTLTDAVTGGTWGSSNNDVATVNSSSGVVTAAPSIGGASSLPVTITYTIGSCSKQFDLTVMDCH